MDEQINEEIAKLLIQIGYNLDIDLKNKYPYFPTVILWIYQKYNIWVYTSRSKNYSECKYYYSILLNENHKYSSLPLYITDGLAYKQALKVTLNYILNKI